MAMAVHDDLLSRDIVQTPYTCFGRLREADPVHDNELYEMRFITRCDDLVWLTRCPQRFSNAVCSPSMRRCGDATWSVA